MTARIVLLMVAAVGLAACESTKVASEPPATPVAVAVQPEDTTPRIVRSPIVPDDDVEVASYTPPKKRVKADTSYSGSDTVEAEEPAAPVSKPDPVTPPAKADTAAKPDDTAKTDTPITTADASGTPPATPTDSGPAPTDTAPDTTDTTATTDATPASDGGTKSMFSDPQAFMQAQFGGFPVWLIALVGIVVLAALIVGLGGRRKPEEVV
jgi:hypothetical protein